MTIYFQYKFHEIPSIGYIFMAEDGKTDGRLMETPDRRVDEWTSPSLYPTALGGG